MSSPLRSVALVLDSQINADALQNLGGVICSFLGPSRNLSLREACGYGSLVLLDWIWWSSCLSESDRPTGWSLANCLRSEPLYYQWEFVEAMKVAASRGDLNLVEWLMTHFSGCEVGVEIVEVAAGAGHLGVLKYLWEHGSEHSSHVINWNGLRSEGAISAGHYDVVHWMHNHGFSEPDGKVVVKVVCRALDIGGKELAEFLVPVKHQLVDYGSHPVRDEMVEWIIACSRDVDCATRAFETLARSGNLDLMQSILLLHSPLPEDQTKWVSSWQEALRYPCKRGNLPMIHWLMEHPMGQVSTRSKDSPVLYLMMHEAAVNGRVDVLEYLTNLGVMVECNGVGRWVHELMITAIYQGELNVFKWMIDHGWCVWSARASFLLFKCAQLGHVEILQFLHDLESVNVFKASKTNGLERCKMSTSALFFDRTDFCMAAYSGHLAVVQWLHVNVSRRWSTDDMNAAAARGHLDIVKWLHSNRDEGCTIMAMDRAAANGYLNVLQWLHANRTEGCTSNAMDDAAENGHFEIVRWLHENTNAGCTIKAMDLAAKNGNLEIMKWLHENTNAGCTIKAITSALSNGHLRVAYWLQSHYSHHIPSEMDLDLDVVKWFDLILFLYVHHRDLLASTFEINSEPQILPEDEVEDEVETKPNLGRIIKWLEENVLPAAS